MKHRVFMSAFLFSILVFQIGSSMSVVKAQTPAPDPFEPDNTWNAANLLLNNTDSPHHTIDNFNDQDWFYFTINNTQSVTVYTNGSTFDDTVMSLYDSNSVLSNTPLYTNDDFGGTLYSGLVVNLNAGTYYVNITSFPQTTVSDYYVHLDVYNVSNGDAFEPDNTWTTANQLVMNASTPTHTIHNTTDVDWFSFTLNSTNQITVYTQGNSFGDTYMDFYDSNSVLTNIASYSNDDWGYSLYSGLSLDLNPGTYYVRISGYSQSIVQDYFVHLDVYNVSTGDAFEPDNSYSLAHQLVDNGLTPSHSIHNSTDVDWFYFSVNTTSDITIYTIGNSSGYTVMDIFDNNSVITNIPISSDGNNSNGYFAYINLNSLSPGTYYVRISGYLDATVLDYQIQLDLPTSAVPDNFENDNSWGLANLLLNNADSPTHSIHNSTDVDWFYFTVNQQSVVTVYTNGSSHDDTYMDLYDSNSVLTNSPIASNDDYGNYWYSQISMTLDPGTYYVRISGYSSSVVSDYYVHLDMQNVSPPNPNPNPNPVTTSTSTSTTSTSISPSTSQNSDQSSSSQPSIPLPISMTPILISILGMAFIEHRRRK